MIQQWVLADYPQLQPMRTGLRQALDAQMPDRDLADVAERMAIVTTELASNALRHAGPPAVVTLSWARHAFVVDVADDRPSAVPKAAPQRPSGVGGRGLTITEELASDTGWHVAQGRKHVWAKFNVPRRGRRSHKPRISVFDLGTFVRLLRRIGS